MNEDSEQRPPSQEPAGSWQFKPDDSGPIASPPPAEHPSGEHEHPQESITWTASEFIAHHKGVGWYSTALFGALTVAALIYVLTRDRISAVAVAVAGVLFCVAAARKPRVLTYSLDRRGVTVGGRFHPYEEFRSFGVLREGPFANIELIAHHRFAPLLSVYCSPEDEDAILDLLSEHVPYEERDHSLVDHVARRLRL